MQPRGQPHPMRKALSLQEYFQVGLTGFCVATAQHWGRAIVVGVAKPRQKESEWIVDGRHAQAKPKTRAAMRVGFEV